MLFRTLEGKLTKINRSDFISDKMYYDKIKSTVLEKINVKDVNKESTSPKFIVTSKQNTSEFIKKYL